METTYSGRDRATTRWDERSARASTAAPVILIGSLVLIVGAFLDWASGTGETAAAATAERAGELSGYNLPDGRIAAGIGFALLVAAGLMWANKRVGSWFDADLLGIALSTMAVAVIVLFLMDLGSTARSAELGAYVSLAGAAIAMIGALVAAVRSGSDRATADDEGHGDIGRREAA